MGERDTGPAGGAEAAATPRAPGTALVPVGEFGPFDAISDVAHGFYVDGQSERAVQACRRWRPLAEAAGDVVTCRYLRYTEAIALQELGRYAESVETARELLTMLDDDPAPVWRAKALAMIAESSTRDGQHTEAMAAIAEADWLVRDIPRGTYGHMSASMAVALALRSVNLYEQADERLGSLVRQRDPFVQLLVAQELAQLSAYWAASLALVGDAEAAVPQYALTAQRALRMRSAAEALGNDSMVARALVLEAWALLGLGEVELAETRARTAAEGFEHRTELLETHLLRIVEGRRARDAGDFATARRHIEAAVDAANALRRDTWLAMALEALADVDVAEFGEVPALAVWKSVARGALARLWAERTGRFAALQDRIHVHRLTQETSRMGRAVLEDPLTGLGNRRRLVSAIESRERPGTSVVFIDIDDFKAVNDEFSHAVGDQVLRRVAGILRDQCRADDVLIRYGGDEFIVLTTGGEDAALQVAHRVHQAIRTTPWDEVAPGLRVTASVGIGHSERDSHVPLTAADSALIAAKRAGRDRVVRSGQPTEAA